MYAKKVCLLLCGIALLMPANSFGNKYKKLIEMFSSNAGILGLGAGCSMTKGMEEASSPKGSFWAGAIAYTTTFSAFGAIYTKETGGKYLIRVGRISPYMAGAYVLGFTSEKLLTKLFGKNFKNNKSDFED